MSEIETSETEILGARIDALEMRLTFQDETIEDLNKAIIEQWKQIEALTRRLNRLDERMEVSEQRADLAGLPEPPPPHY
jgi:SlyX protein